MAVVGLTSEHDRQALLWATGFGESYEDNAVRELEEEMGITGACLETLFDFWYSDDTCRLWGRLFRYLQD